MVDHKFHFAATVFTFGVWAVPWLVLAIDESRRPWRCTICGSRHFRKAGQEQGSSEPKRERKNHLVGTKC